MGTPSNKHLHDFSVREMSDTLSLAKSAAMDFRSVHARVAVLDHLRTSLLPMVEWLDKPAKDCFPGPWSNTLHAPMKRAMSFFRRFEELHPVALTRKNAWITIASDGTDAMVMNVSSEWLAAAISDSRYAILGATRPYREETLVIAESMGMKDVVEHCAFLRYLASGMEGLDEMLKERERRLHVMQKNSSFLKSFVEGMDPLEYCASGSSIPGYSLWNKYPQGTSRCSGTYFVPGPVEEVVAVRNASRTRGDDCSFYVFDDSHQISTLDSFLFKVGISIMEVSEHGQCARGPFSDEEKKIIADFANKIGR